MPLLSLHHALRHTCRRLLQSPSLASAAPPLPSGQLSQLTSLLPLVCQHTEQARPGFATWGAPEATADAAVPEAEAEAPLHPSAQLHIRRQREKPQNSNRNAFKRAEKKKLQIKTNARLRRKQEAAAAAERDAARIARWRAAVGLRMPPSAPAAPQL